MLKIICEKTENNCKKTEQKPVILRKNWKNKKITLSMDKYL